MAPTDYSCNTIHGARDVISDASKSKLNSFRYHKAKPDSNAARTVVASAGASDMAEDTVGSRGVDAEKTGQLGKEERSIEQAGEITLDRPNISSSANGGELPETPFKLSLSKLINNDNSYTATPMTEPSPEDRILWKSNLSSSASRDDTPNKRDMQQNNVHSHGSPPSSPLAAAKSTLPPRGQPANTKKHEAPPCNDIAAELWNRYLISTGKPAKPATDKPSTDLPPLTPDPIKRDLKLRRAASCNSYWPTANRKRRRLDKDLRSGLHATSKVISKGTILSPESSSGGSKINILVGKIQETLKKAPTKLDEREPSASVPLPKNTAQVVSQSDARTDGIVEAQHIDFGKESSTNDKLISTSELDDFDFNDALLLDSETSIENVAKSSPPVVPRKVSARTEPPTAVGNERSEFSDDDLDDDAFLELLTEKPSLPGTRMASGSSSSSTLNDGAVKVAATSTTTPNRNQGDRCLVSSNDKAESMNARSATVQPTSSRRTSRSKTFAAAKTVVDDEFDDAFDDDLDEIFAELAESDGVGSKVIPGEDGGSLSADDHDESPDGRFSPPDQVELNQGTFTQSYLPHRTKVIQRYHVLDAAKSSYRNQYGQVLPEKVLYVQEERTERHLAVILRDSWYDSTTTKGAYIHIVGDFTRNGQCIVDDTNNMIILHPDHLISATVVASSFSCMRQAVLQDRIKVTDDASKPQVYGMILHEIFQQALKENRWDLPWLKSVIDKAVVNNIENLYEIDVSVNEATRHLMSKMPLLRKWANTFMMFNPSPESLMQDRGGGTSKISINKLLEVEEHAWSPMYGLKGNVDATVQVSLQDGKEKRMLTIPLEFKTGIKDTSEVHRAQTAMYCLLLSDRYDIDVTFGVLYYLEKATTLRTRAIRQEIIHMIQQRNELAEFVRNKFDLPPMIKKPAVCNGCYSKHQCFLYHKLLENGDGVISGMGQKFEDLTDHLTPAHQVFFVKWERLLTLEEHEMMKFRRELWSMLSHERETAGRCFGGLVVEPQSAIEDTEGPKINRFKYTFIKKHHKTGFTFADSQIRIGEPIVVSDEDGHFALANGYVTHISSRKITVAVDRRLHNSRTRTKGFDADTNQSFTGIMEIVEQNGQPSTLHPNSTENDTVYRLDKDEFSNGMALVRNNLLSMMSRENLQSKRLRELIIDDNPPRFKSLPSSAITTLPMSQTNLNVDQKNAIEKVLSAENYALVLGMPGTGKTTTIAHIIRALVSKGKSVLLTSYTHTAVDNILLKTRKDGYRTLRIGAISKVHPEVREFVDLASTSRQSIEELHDVYENSQIVATTCLGISHPVFNHRNFDYCIVDEASQITLPVCLGPIRLAKIFVLVGDHFQLPPLVQNREALEQGLDVSLFRWLCDRQPQSVVYLEHQYRMCKEVMHLSNHLIYNNHLKCGTPDIAAAQLSIPNIQGLKRHHITSLRTPSLSTPCKEVCLGLPQGRCWLRDLIDPSAKARLVNTDTLETRALEDAKGSRIVNDVEATIVAQLVDSFISVGISATEIGVVTLYRSQLALLQTRLNHRLPDLEMHTADRFQGRDKEVIIMSCVRSNPENNVGDLLRDYRRVNVAFTRARTKLLVVGSRSTLHGGTELLAKFVRLMAGKGWIYDLPQAAVKDHVFEEQHVGMTQNSPREQSDMVKDGSKIAQQVTAEIKTERNDESIRSPLKTIGDGYNYRLSSSSKRVHFSQSAKRNESGSPLVLKEKRNMKADRRTRLQPNKVGAKPLDGSKVISRRSMLRDCYNELEG
ncbi:Tripartite DNA replication factor [Ascosphaera aggregata]|nr:Tripartite DNA replication factor [Ascosphaera aggregata]